MVRIPENSPCAPSGAVLASRHEACLVISRGRAYKKGAEMSRSSWLRRAATATAGVGMLVALAVVPTAVAGKAQHVGPRFGELHRAHNATAKDEGGGDEGNEVLERAAQEEIMKTAPGSSVSAAAYTAAQAQAAQIPDAGRNWHALTDKPFLNDPVPGYRDPVWSDFGSGYGLVTGRMTALTASGGAIFAGGADGGVWKSTDRGGHWRFWSTGLPRLSIGALATNPARRIGMGRPRRGEHERRELHRASACTGSPPAATCGTASAGASSRAATSTTSTSIGAGHVYAATNSGLYRHSAARRRAVAPGAEARPEPDALALSDVADHGRRRSSRAPAGMSSWRRSGGAAGRSRPTWPSTASTSRSDWGKAGTFHRITPTRRHRRRTTSAGPRFAAGGGRIYAIIESPEKLANPSGRRMGSRTCRASSSRRAATRPARGRWSPTPPSSPTPARREPALGQFPGAQTWYNQYIAVDPHNPLHVYAGDGGGIRDPSTAARPGRRSRRTSNSRAAVLPEPERLPADRAHRPARRADHRPHVLHRQRRRRLAAPALRPCPGRLGRPERHAAHGAVLRGRHRPDGRRRRLLGRPAGQWGDAPAAGRRRVSSRGSPATAAR